MFDHLAPASDLPIVRKKTNFKLYGSFLVFALLILLSVWTFGRSTGSSADVQPPSAATAIVFAVEKSVTTVKDIPNLSVFDFSIKTDNSFIFIKEIKIKSQGISDDNLLTKLRLFHNSTQLGQLSKVEDRWLYFDLGDYKLDQGENNFQLRLTTDDNLPLIGMAIFSLEDPSDIILSYQDHLFRPDGNFPISGQKTSVIEHGQMVAYNSLVNNKIILPAGKNSRLADWFLSTQSEPISVGKIIISYPTDQNLAQQKFILSSKGQIIAQSEADAGQIIFNLSQPVVINSQQDVSLELWGTLSQIGNYQFSLAVAEGQGFISGTKTILNTKLILSEVIALENVPVLTQAEVSSKLSDGWNNVYSLEISNSGSELISIDKLTWDIQALGTQILDLELWIDNEPYVTELTMKGNLIIAEFEKQPLVISDSAKLDLLVKVKDLANQSRLQANLLFDLASDLESNNNFLWSIGEKQANGYYLVNQLLKPLVLSK